jgi:sigma-54 specific flagellar transcriptional regulator A
VHAPTSPIVEVIRTCKRIAPSDATGSCSRRDRHRQGGLRAPPARDLGRTSRQFVPVNCGAIPETLLESELFGFVRGAFTGAISARRGRVALAEGGTLFLDEIGEMPLALQVKLLRLLQERTYEPVGSSESVTANFRLIAATNRDLELEVKAGRFRRDLYYRLHVCPVGLPPLRERPEDISALFNHFWRQRGEQRPIAPEVLRCLEGYSWPGNVRELENLVERISVCSEGRVIRLVDLPAMVRGEENTETRFIDQIERDALTAQVPSLVPAPPPAIVAPAPAPAPPAVGPRADARAGHARTGGLRSRRGLGGDQRLRASRRHRRPPGTGAPPAFRPRRCRCRWTCPSCCAIWRCHTSRRPCCRPAETRRKPPSSWAWDAPRWSRSCGAAIPTRQGRDRDRPLTRGRPAPLRRGRGPGGCR